MLKNEKSCQRIIKLGSEMRSSRIINGRGHLVAGGMKEGLLSLEAQKQDEMMVNVCLPEKSFIQLAF